MNFLEQSAHDIIATHGNNLSGLTVILPTHRACYFFRKALEQTGQTLWLPEITTFTDWVGNTSGLQPISAIEQLLLLHQIYLELGGADDIDNFLVQGRTIIADFDEMDMHLVREDWFFRELRSLASLKVYEPATELNAAQMDYLKFWERFESMFKALRKQLLAAGRGNTGMMFRKVANEIETIAEGMQGFYFAGFNGLTKSEEHIIKYLHQTGKATVLWDADKYYVEQPFQEAGLFFRKYFKEWKGEHNHYLLDNITTQPKQINIISVARNIGQVKAAASIIAHELEITNENAAKTAVILPDEKLLMPLQMALPANVHHYNITMGLPLSRAHTGAFFLLLFRLHELSERVSKRNRQQRIYHKDLIALIRHSYTNVFLSKAQLHKLETTIRHKNLVFITQKFLSEITEVPAENMFVQMLFQPERGQAYLEHITNIATTLLEHFRRYKEHEMDVEFLHRILSVCTAIQQQLGEAEISAASLRNLLTDEFRNARVPFEGEPALGLQIMGLMESRGLDFDNIILLSANEGLLPAGKGSKSYIPHPLRNEALFSYREKDSITAYLFYRLLHRAKNVYLIYNTEGDQMGGGEKSRYVLQLQQELKAFSNITFKSSVFAVPPPPRNSIAPITIPKTDTVMEKLRANAAYGLSPSALNLYVNCSLQYYFRYVAGLKVPDEIEEDMETNTLGTAVHYVLEQLYQSRIGAAITVEWLKEIRSNHALIHELLVKGFDDRFDEESLMQGRNHLQFSISLKMIDMFLQAEIERLQTAGASVTIIGLEEELEAMIQVGAEQIKIKGKADRIEAQNGSLAIADYKTGKAGEVKLKAEQLAALAQDPEHAKAFQLLTYAWTYLQVHPDTTLPIQSGIYWLQQPQRGLDTLRVDGMNQLHKDEIAAFEEQLMLLLTAMFDPNLPFEQTEDEARCKYCDYKRICRR